MKLAYNMELTCLQRDDASMQGSPSAAAEAHLKAFNAAKFEVCHLASPALINGSPSKVNRGADCGVKWHDASTDDHGLRPTADSRSFSVHSARPTPPDKEALPWLANPAAYLQWEHEDLPQQPRSTMPCKHNALGCIRLHC